MNSITYLFYVITVGLIRIYKWIEYQILLIFTPLMVKQCKKIFASIGVILYCPEDLEGVQNTNKLSTGFAEEKVCDLKKFGKVIHVKLHSNKVFAQVGNLGILGLGESFMDGLWHNFEESADDIAEVGIRILENNLLDYYYHPWNRFLEWAELHAFNLQTTKRVFQVGEAHYDLGNEIFETMLGPWMQYTSGYWKDVDNLNDAQLQKMDLLAKKLDLKPGMRVLDIGCGWGTLCKYLAEKYKVECVGITIGENGAAYARRVCTGLPVKIRVQDYREVTEKFDRIVSVGMFEHVGFRNYREFFTVANQCLKDDGIFVLHTIGRNHSNVPRSEPWINKYIFPNGNLPDPEDIAKSTKDLFVIEDWHNFGTDYAKTLHCWRNNFIRGWPKLEKKYGDGNFYKMWIFYLCIAQALFKSRRTQLWQIVLSKDGLKWDYRAAR